MSAFDLLRRLSDEALLLVRQWLDEERESARNETVEKAGTAPIDKVRLAAGGHEKLMFLIKKVESEYERREREQQ